MAYEIYDGIEWEIDDFPIGSSTPDELFEMSFNATGTCENGHKITGIAHYWSSDDSMFDARLESIDYDECEECDLLEEDEFDDEDF